MKKPGITYDIEEVRGHEYGMIKRRKTLFLKEKENEKYQWQPFSNFINNDTGDEKRSNVLVS